MLQYNTIRYSGARQIALSKTKSARWSRSNKSYVYSDVAEPALYKAMQYCSIWVHIYKEALFYLQQTSIYHVSMVTRCNNSSNQYCNSENVRVQWKQVSKWRRKVAIWPGKRPNKRIIVLFTYQLARKFKSASSHYAVWKTDGLGHKLGQYHL